MNPTPLNDSSDIADELDDNIPRRKRNMLETTAEQAASPLPKLSLPNTFSRNEYFPYMVVGKELPSPITIQTGAGQIYRINHPTNQFKEEEPFWDMLGGLVAEVREAVGM